MDVIHINAEFDYLERASDHDPLIARLTMAPIQVSFSEASYQVNEGDGSISITVSLSSMVALPVTINFSTASNTATAGDDFSEVSGQLEFTYGEISKNIVIPIIDDDIWEWLETFTIELTTPQNALLGSNYLAVITIHDNEETFFLHMPFIIND